MFKQPLVSIIVTGYEQEQFIREAIESSIVQKYDPLEIILSDDASRDRTFQIMTEVANSYRGPHRIILNRNSQNMGLAANLNRAVELASGALLIIQDGDDISVPHRVSTLVQKWLSSEPRPDLIFSDTLRIGSDGRILQKQIPPKPLATLEEVISGNDFIAGAAASAYSRRLFEIYGPLSPRVVYTDYVLTFRALLEGGCAFVDEPLVSYRVHEKSITRIDSTAEKTRLVAARWAEHAVAEESDRLHAWDLRGKKHWMLRQRLVRNLVRAQLDARSSGGSRWEVLKCIVCATAVGKPRAAWTFFHRDFLRWPSI